MNKYIKEFLDIILSINFYSKRIIAIIIDVIFCILCTWLAFALRLEQLIIFKDFKATGMKRKLLDISIAKKYGWKHKVSLSEGFKLTLDDFLKN